MRRNRRNAPALPIEREQLQDLPVRRTTDFDEEQAMVTRSGTFTVRAILCSAPSRLIGHLLKVRLYGDRLDCYLSGALVLTLARGTRTARQTAPASCGCACGYMPTGRTGLADVLRRHGQSGIRVNISFSITFQQGDASTIGWEFFRSLLSQTASICCSSNSHMRS